MVEDVDDQENLFEYLVSSRIKNKYTITSDVQRIASVLLKKSPDENGKRNVRQND